MAEGGRKGTQFRRVRKERPAEHTPIADNEIRITNNGFVTQYIQYALDRLDPKSEKHFDEIILQGMGRAIAKTVQIAETVKRRVKGLHQIVEISSTKITDYYEPTVVGMEPKGFERTISVIQIKLSTKPLDTSNPGYQEPLPDEEVRDPRPKAERPERGERAPKEGAEGDAKKDGAVADRPPRSRGARRGRGGAGGGGGGGGYYGGGGGYGGGGRSSYGPGAGRGRRGGGYVYYEEVYDDDGYYTGGYGYEGGRGRGGYYGGRGYGGGGGGGYYGGRPSRGGGGRRGRGPRNAQAF